MLYDHKPKTKKSLKDDPQPIGDTPALRKQELDQMEKDELIIPTESLQEIHPSIIAQPRIENVKKDAKVQRSKEIQVLADEDTTMDDIPETNLVEKKSNDRIKHIKLVSETPSYNVKGDLNSLRANITVAQLMDVSPKVRAEVIKQLKFDKELNKEKPRVNLVYRGKIAISKCKVFDVPSKVFLDYGAGINLISKSFLDKLPNKPEPISIATSSIVQVLSDVDQTPGLIY